MSVSKSGYYDWHKRPANVISLETLPLCQDCCHP
ncbi:hypothetical protein Sbal_4309 [Shewanella baltica OS155]|uniref:Uncharacterized protein n=1 Tax=Shewanella baltica (strain OS155 / ATCC BAA-1091) TaxID=325240 RepID=A3DAL0_SHEB5|nr:hypothetical protein Sbal_4309 [Shewanella baltica OS155]